MQDLTAKETEMGDRKLKTPNPNWNVVWQRPKGHSNSLVQWKSEVKEMLKLERLKIRDKQCWCASKMVNKARTKCQRASIAQKRIRGGGGVWLSGRTRACPACEALSSILHKTHTPERERSPK